MMTKDTNQACVSINLHIFIDYKGCCLLGYNLCSKIHSVSRMKLLRANSHTNKSYIHRGMESAGRFNPSQHQRTRRLSSRSSIRSLEAYLPPTTSHKQTRKT